MIDASFPNAADLRKHSAGIFPREGIFPDATTIAPAGIAFAGAAWAVSARAFVANLKRGGAPFSQTYGSTPISNDGVDAAAWTIPGAPGTGSRIDLLWIRARDTTQGDSAAGAPTDGPSGATRTGIPEWGITSGVASGSPVAPALPSGAYEIARALVPAAAVSAAGATITQSYRFAYVVGGPLLGRTKAELDEYIPPDGTLGFTIDTDVIYQSNGTTWISTRPFIDGIVNGASAGALPATTDTDIPGTSKTFTLDRTRNCLITFGAGYQINGDNDARLMLSIDAATVSTLDMHGVPGLNGQKWGMSGVWIVSLAAGAHTIKLRGWAAAAGTVAVTDASWAMTTD